MMQQLSLRRLKARCGFTLIETTLAVSIFTLLSLGGLALVVSATSSWNRDFTRGSLEGDVGLAMRQISDTLRGSVSVMVDNNGQGITYWLPQRDINGQVSLPLQSDGVARRIWYDQSTSSIVMTGRNRALCEDVDLSGTQNRLFTLRPSSKAIVITIRASQNTGKETLRAAKTEVVRIRNYHQ